MTKEEALYMLENTPYKTKEPSRLNPALSQMQGVDIVRRAVLGRKTGEILDYLLEKRVWQVCQNKKRPNYAPAK